MMVAYTHPFTVSRLSTAMRLAVVLICFLALGQSAEASAVDTSEALVIVNDDTVTVSDLNALLVDVHTSMQAEDRIDFDYRRLLNKLVNDRLIIQEALALGMHEEPRMQEQLDSIRTRKAISSYVKDQYRPDLTITDDEIHTYFRKYYSRLQVRSLAVASEEVAASLADSIRSGASMDSLAQDTSVDMYRYQGGLHNFKYYGDVENIIRDVADRLEPGEISDPFRYRKVWSIIRLEQRAAPDPDELEAQRKKITAVLRYQKNQEEWESFIDSLLDVYAIQVDSPGLDEVRADSAALFSQEFMHGTDRVLFRASPDLTVTDDEFRKMVSRLAMTMATTPFDSMVSRSKRDALKELALSAAAQDDGYVDQPEVIRYQHQVRDSMLVEAYLQETIVPRIAFNREEFDTYYREHLDEFRYPTKYQFDRIIVQSEDTGREISRRLKDGGEFYFVGRQYDAQLSTPTEAAEWLSLTSFPDSIQHEIEAMTIGHTTAPHPTTEGWLILRLKAKRQGEPRPMEEVEMQIRQVMFQRRFSELLDETLDILKENSDIEYNDRAIERYFSAEG